MSKNYQLNIIKKIKKVYKTNACERYHNLSKEENKESNNIVVNITKISQSMKKKKKLFDYRKKYYKMKRDAFL